MVLREVWAALKETAVQTAWLCRKNLLLLVRHWPSTLAELLIPILFLSLLALIQIAEPVTTNGNIPSTPSTVPTCVPWVENQCFTLLFAPWDDELAAEAMGVFALQNNVTLVDSYNVTNAPNASVIAFPDEQSILNWTIAHPNVTMGAVTFVRNCSYTRPSYTLWYNGTCPYSLTGLDCADVRPQLQTNIDRALATVMAHHHPMRPPDLRASFGAYPVVGQASDAVRTYGVMFFYCGISFFAVILLYRIVYEKEHKLRQGMRMIGLRGSAYWLSWFIVHSLLLSLITTLLLLAGGYMFRFQFFLATDFSVLILTFFLFALSLSQLAFLSSTVVNTTKTAVALGMLLFIVGLLFTLVCGVFGNLIFPALYSGSPGPRAVKWFLYILPMFHFAKSVTDISALSWAIGPLRGQGFQWKDLFTTSPLNDGGSAEPTIHAFYWELGLSLFFSLLTWYLDHVIPSDGSPFPPYFFLTPSYWGLSTPIAIRPREYDGPAGAEDLREEFYAATRSVNAMLRVVSLSKSYNPSMFSSQGTVHAVQNLSLAAEEGSVLCLLGHNGAGKTTAIGMLTALFSPTSGDAFVCGRSVVSQASQVRRNIGVCPQYDILWSELTPYEHLELFSVLKHVPSERRHAQIMEILESVRLVRVRDQPVGPFSGGMKRRLSVALATVGNPRVIFLDEPTTGMDPLSRRHIWSLIQRVKQGRVVFLTTHSMEEADVVADRIGVLVQGRLRCVGTGLELKQRFGAGYRISLVGSEKGGAARVKVFVHQHLPAAELVKEIGDQLIFRMPLERIVDLAPFLELLERGEGNVRDWSVSHTTLEEVFLQVNRIAYEL